MSLDLPILLFETPEAMEDWLAANHETAPGIWLRIAKKASPMESVTYDEALDLALCYGWIDGLIKKYDEDSWVQRFTPRRAKSVWSKRNKGLVDKLVASGKMQPCGQAQVDAAKADGRWNAAYDSARTAEVPDDLQAELERRPSAKAFFETLTGSNRYAILYRLQTAKRAETRSRRLAKFVEMLENEEKFY